MTTDPFPKEAAAEVTVRGRTFRVGGMAKGSGMIEPMMATMLGFVTTDAGGRAGAAAARAEGGVPTTPSTRSASTASARPTTASSRSPTAPAACTLGEADYPLLVAALQLVCEPLAIDIVRGGEGATKLITIRVIGAKTNEDAKTHRARDRQLAAGQDGGARRRSELGTARGRRRTRDADAGPRARQGPGRTGGALRQRRAVRRARAGGRGVPAGQGHRRSRSISAPAAAAKRGCGRAI